MEEIQNDEKSNSGNDSARPWQSYNTVYTNAKAGMEGVDKEKVQRVVYEMSKGSKYFEHEEKKEAYMKHKIESFRAQLAKLTDSDLSHHRKIADRKIAGLEATRDLSRIWLHVDMDAFYAAVETLSNPSLKGKPMAVGSMSMLSTANYEARKFGVRAAMPGFIARKLCPELIFVPTDFKKYNHFSGLTRKVFERYDPNFLAASLDEAYLDITNFCNEKGMTGGQVAEELRESVHKETGLTCSAGVAPNRLLAKVCSDINKPNGQFVLPNERVAVVTFISSLPIRKIGGIGKVTENILKGVLGITTCEEMLQKSSFICALFSHASADFFLSVSLGIGRTDTPQASQRKSMSTERTFSPTGDKASIFQKLVDLSENLSSDLKKEGIRGRTLTLKLKTSSFEVRTRAVTLSYNTCSSEDILKQAKKLLKAELPVSLRLMGLRMSNFGEGREGVAADPKQKTLSNFLGADDASRRGLGAQVQLESTICDDALAIIDTESSLCGDIHEPSESIDFADTYQIHDSEHTGTRHFHSESETREAFNLQIDNLNEKVCHHDTVGAAADLLPTGTGRLVERDSSSGLCEESSFDQHKRDCSNGEAGSSLNPRDTICWLNDYQCSVCGAELPPSFIEERQEHFDFHLAERLQDEESINRNRLVKPPNLRFAEKGDMSNRKKKKQKRSSPSEGKHIPIDAFFAKTSQNF
ncbi:DNA polymerase kappa isoform X1 [Salvia hispanica]|uniref:DNA polymerase kappa isoform X1 n=1 Tax=Salvia hispanica TaxID=49212 RepID=UPI0020093D8B|nr:DNA polymerase kappa isoform X1 [Salvia hispanica]